MLLPCLLLTSLAPAFADLMMEVSCDECRAAARDFTKYLLSDQSLGEQSEILQRQVCPQNPDSELASICREFIEKWYGSMAQCIYTNIFLEQELCGLLGPCSLSSAALYHHTWECKDCRSMLARTAEYLAQEDTLTKVVSLLQGPCFCGEGEIIECDSLVTTITPMALPFLAHSLTSLSDRHCREVLAVC